MAEEKEVIKEIAQEEEGHECHYTDTKDQLFVLLLRVTQANGRLLPIGGFMNRAMTQMIHDITGGNSKGSRYFNKPRDSF